MNTKLVSCISNSTIITGENFKKMLMRSIMKYLILNRFIMVYAQDAV